LDICLGICLLYRKQFNFGSERNLRSVQDLIKGDVLRKQIFKKKLKNPQSTSFGLEKRNHEDIE